MSDPCGAPNRGGSVPGAAAERGLPTGGTHDAALVTIPGGTYRMGDESDRAYADDGEAPVHPVELGSFLIDRHAATNEQFAIFIDASGWQTDAEAFGWSFGFAGLLPDEYPPTRNVAFRVAVDLPA